MATEFSEILSDKEPEKTEVAEVEKPEKTEEVERVTSRRQEHRKKEYAAQDRDPETGQFLAKEEEKKEEKTEVKEEVKVEVKEPPKQEFTDKEKAFLRGLEEERRKRQELEKKLAELEKGQPKGEKKTFWDDPEGHLQTHEQKIAAQTRDIKLTVSETIARSKYQDFDEKIAVFAEILQTPAGPGVHAQFMAAPDPAEFAYRLGKQTKELKDAGSIEGLKAKIEKETREKLEAEYKKKQEELEKQRKELPSSLSEVRGTTQHKAVFKGPTPFEDILGRK